MKNGIGTYYCDDGNKYEGEWKVDMMNGIGIFFYNNGNKYEGEWLNGTKNGIGTFYIKFSEIIMDGSWYDDFHIG